MAAGSETCAATSTACTSPPNRAAAARAARIRAKVRFIGAHYPTTDEFPNWIKLTYPTSVRDAAFDTPQPMAMTSAKPIVSSDFRLMSPPLSVTPCSACSVLSPALLTCLHQFVHVRRGPNLENVAVLQGRMLRNELYSMIHVPRLEDENTAELFLGFRVGTVGGCHFAVLPVNGQRGFRRLERFSASPMPVGAKMVIVIKACVEHGVLFSRGHALEFAFVVVSETHVFHGSSPLP